MIYQRLIGGLTELQKQQKHPGVINGLNIKIKENMVEKAVHILIALMGY